MRKSISSSETSSKISIFLGFAGVPGRSFRQARVVLALVGLLLSTLFAGAAMAEMVIGIDVHNYTRPDAYGFTASSGGDRMGAALVVGNVSRVRGGTVGDTAFLNRLASFRKADGTQQVKEVIISLEPLATTLGAPADLSRIATLLQSSVVEANRLGIKLSLEGLNEWDLFYSRSYNAGVVPAGWTQQQFILQVQAAEYNAGMSYGVPVLGPSVGHPTDPASLAFFPNVSAYVNIVNAHIYGVTDLTTLTTIVNSMKAFQGSGKPVWVTESGISSYNGVTEAQQASGFQNTINLFRSSNLIARLYGYEALDEYPANTWVKGSSGWPYYTGDSDSYHWGLLANYYGAPKQAASVISGDIAAHP
jgi:hypothetical protein